MDRIKGLLARIAVVRLLIGNSPPINCAATQSVNMGFCARPASEAKRERAQAGEVAAARPGRPRPGLKTYRKSSPGASGAGEDYRRCIITTMTTAPELSDSPSILRRWRTDPACCTHHLAPDTDEQQGNQRLDLRLFDQARR